MQRYDILVFTESWLFPHISNYDIKLTNISLPYRNARDDRQAEGVEINVKEGLQSRHRPDLISGNTETVCIEISVKVRKCFVSGFYRPPNTGTNYWDKIEATIENMSNSTIKELTVLGDFNCDRRHHVQTRWPIFHPPIIWPKWSMSLPIILNIRLLPSCK